MARWVHNIYRISGPVEQLAAIVARGVGWYCCGDTEQEVFCLNNFVTKSEDILEADYDEQAAWEKENWGVLWGAAQTSIRFVREDSIEVLFMTPWTIASVFHARMADMFDELSFDLLFYDIEGELGGVRRWKNGRLAESIDHRRAGFRNWLRLYFEDVYDRNYIDGEDTENSEFLVAV